MSLLQKSGYLMEQEVATQFEELGFVVTPNAAFQDLDTGESREIDVKAFMLCGPCGEGSPSVCAEFHCECKNTRTPFVFLARNKNPADQHHIPQEYVFPVDTFEKELPKEKPNETRIFADPAWRHLDLAPHHYYSQQDWKAVQFCRVCRSGKRWELNHGGVYDSLIFPLVKDLIAQKQLYKKHGLSQVHLYFPMVVLSCPIYLVDTRAKDPKPEEVSHVTLTRHINSKTVSGQFMIDFVSQSGIEDFVKGKAMPFVDHLASIATDDPLRITQKRIAPEQWNEKMG